MGISRNPVGGADRRQSSGLSRSQWKMILIASLGGSLEFYDFIVYGFFAHNIAAQFFPSASSLISMLATFSVLAIGYVIRPLGGIVLSSWGDRYGRRPVFLGSIIVVTTATICLGLLPNYQSWGMTASLLLILLRMLQGFCVGGEMPGAITYAVEAAPHRAGLAAGIIICAVNVGVLLATFVNLGIQTYLSATDAAAYGWRIAFLFGGVCGIASYLMRRNLDESPEFKEMHGAVVKQPFRETLRRHGKAVATGALSIAVMAGINGVLYGHMPAYLVQQLHYAPRTAAIAQNAYLIVSSFGLLAAGWLGDKIPRRYLLRASAALLIALSYPFYEALASHTVNPVLLFVLAGLVFSLASGTWASVLADQFPVQVRFSGIALAYNISVVAFSGFAPLLATMLIRVTGSLAAPAWYVIGACTVALLASYGLPTGRSGAGSPSKTDGLSGELLR
ncbi:putative MFS family arabinose efflux permease [Paraburkholderia sp. BL6669N2]|uniref:MFS transporter n=1 Tax=unclassified Paraburkholderia TaxID=2615204 RepID=UPI000E240A19|nr:MULTISPECIES: MFS transporter [unclassified Paraburkholderia]REG48850.1 putative MFS family arabinose efflux permease [Paraburkholderia sp. BL6669N2]TDY21323.1 putative MFS family arabinose efflux permease [Paraburkholderia sp. BL6665CI2N2]